MMYTCLTVLALAGEKMESAPILDGHSCAATLAGGFMLTQERLKELLHYNPETGIFTRIVARGSSKAGSVAGCLNSEGYIMVCIDRKKYYAHRLAWFYINADWPDTIDHINMDRSDNRIYNLRSCKHRDNLKNTGAPSNNTSGIKGVCWHSQAKKWRAYICVDYKQNHLGLFDKKEDAEKAIRKSREKLHGEFANHG